ncbi:related to Protein-tyrosine phosphatase, receptor type 1 [Melanopsichium pennsylvanicum]|uniref:Related to Protein-tyrosine phosphatase, receptor type 1 n=2 Tax=Melanopsichium pennsylvanicum TaxID=63383 RepID=A0AAJ4XH50_9BASI|nr:related to Protein-tyrosine phosphatase, receptor type 1 [Melanopsichium pennsylvanicum]
MSTQPLDTATKTKSRRSLLPSLNFGSSSPNAMSSASRPPPAPSSSAPSSSGAEPDYFATIHVPDPNAPNPGAVCIASPFALTTPLVSGSGARVPSRPNGTDVDSQDSKSHPWAKLFPDGGMATALPEGFRVGRLGVPPTPAASVSSVPNKMQLPNAGTSVPPDFRRNLILPPRLQGGLPSSSSLPLPASSDAINTKARALADDLSKFKALDVDGLAEALKPPSWTQQHKASPAVEQSATSNDVLILDIRPSTSFFTARVASSINICAPSTLLKRPAITVERIEDEMLGSASDRRRFMRWRKGPLKPKPDAKPDAKPGSTDQDSTGAVPKRVATISSPEEPGVNKIIVLDTDTSRIDGTGNATAGGGGPCLIGVLKKFEAAGFAGELCWLVGGFNKLARSKKALEFIDTGMPTIASEQDSASTGDSARTQSPVDVRSRKPPTLHLNGMAPTPSFGSPAESMDERKSLVQPRSLPMDAFQTQSTVAGWPGQSKSPAKESSQHAGGEPFKLNLVSRQQNQSDNGCNSSAAPQAGGAYRPAAACANPFFDNIRQNRELQHGITEKIPMDLPQMSESQVRRLPPFLQKLVHMNEADRALALAQAFFDIEKAEQNRLIATMQQHSAESDQDPRSKDFASAQAAALQGRSSSFGGRHLDPNSHVFPFSIAAALERGADNRYNNIWTYEHSRVRLSKPRSAHDPGSDYLNGSFVQPPHQFGSKRRYLATQAPLPSTFDAFWTAVWEQNSRVIVMLTREHESGRLQSHPYWLQSEFGDNIRLTKLEEVVLDESGRKMRTEECDGILNEKHEDARAPFPTMLPQHQDGIAVVNRKREPTTVRRTLLLKNLAEPQSAPRRIVQLQYIAWPDYHIPETPESLLMLMDLADSAQNHADIELNSVGRGRGLSAGPMVVHCSAGVGRTGAFIVIDAALDVLRRARRRQKMLNEASEPPTWESNLVANKASPTADYSTPEVDMTSPSSPLGDRLPRVARRSLKRELSPTGMDIDSSSHSGRDLSSPPPMFRSRSNESGGGNGDNLSSSLGSTGSIAKGVPKQTCQSMQPSSVDNSATAGSSEFTNPFTSPTFRFNSSATARLRSAVGTSMQHCNSQDSPRHAQDGSNGADLTFSPTRAPMLQLGAQDWRQAAASSPFSEVSTPSMQGGGGSARSSFSSAAEVHSRFSSSSGLSPTNGVGAGGDDDQGARGMEEALLNAMNPFDLAISQQQQNDGERREAQQQQHSSAARAGSAANGDTSTSTVTGSNEPTPYDASSSTCVSGFRGGSSSSRGECMPASNSGGSTGSFADGIGLQEHTPNTWIQSTRANQHNNIHMNNGSSNGFEAQLVSAPKDYATLNHNHVEEGDGNGDSNKVVEEAVRRGDDVIRTIVEEVREQRMSLIQTGRQFVFVYSAVLTGLLRDLTNEGVC